MEVEITWKNAPHKVSMKPLSWGEYKIIKRNSIVVKMVDSGSYQQFRDIDKYAMLITLHSIGTAPFDKTEANLEQLSFEDGQALEKAAFQVNPNVPNFG